jgi:hypothetical protein
MVRWALIIFLLYVIPCSLVAATTTPPSDKAVVKVGLFVSDISAINEHDETVELEGNLYVSWQDKSLVSDQTQYYTGQAALIKLRDIWRPYLQIQHSRGKRQQEAIFLKISKTGEVFYQERFNVTIETELNIRQFPFDHHQLTIIVQPFTTGYGNIVMQADMKRQGKGQHTYIQQWKVSNYHATVINPTTTQPDIIPQYVYSLDYARQPGYFVLKVLLPLLIIMILSWLGCWLTGEALVNRIAFMMTAVLTMVAFQWILFRHIPLVSYYTFFDAIVLFSYITVGSNMLLLVVAHHVAAIRRRHLEIKLIRYIPVFYILGWLLISWYFFGN